MTNNEAIDILKLYQIYGSDYLTAPYQQKDVEEAIATSINALETSQPEIVPIGTKVRVTDRIHGHNFEIGCAVIISDVFFYTPYECTHFNGYYNYLSREEFEII
jgi:hypothetical protein